MKSADKIFEAFKDAFENTYTAMQPEIDSFVVRFDADLEQNIRVLFKVLSKYFNEFIQPETVQNFVMEIDGELKIFNKKMQAFEKTLNGGRRYKRHGFHCDGFCLVYFGAISNKGWLLSKNDVAMINVSLKKFNGDLRNSTWNALINDFEEKYGKTIEQIRVMAANKSTSEMQQKYYARIPIEHAPAAGFENFNFNHFHLEDLEDSQYKSIKLMKKIMIGKVCFYVDKCIKDDTCGELMGLLDYGSCDAITLIHDDYFNHYSGILTEPFLNPKWSREAHKKQEIPQTTVLALDLFKKLFDPLNEDEFVDFFRYQTAAMFPAELTYDYLHCYKYNADLSCDTDLFQ